MAVAGGGADRAGADGRFSGPPRSSPCPARLHPHLPEPAVGWDCDTTCIFQKGGCPLGPMEHPPPICLEGKRGPGRGASVIHVQS